ncbi:polymer-forming cytoskeletal protein [Proteiniphilum sp. X52]|uniref:bactofilin family protein n=1 Tax=Proteiniphilum sp. X52 TaxID=2382159 RepID=UPI000F09F352|nr:polymer-forming cytoskeletal protein [Proteiniphilum sp. X52]RNC66374.1 polymer-forming cytoskeletal protein [Proteiniphilum sp. X52]
MKRKKFMAKEERKKDIGVSKLDSLPITTVVGNDMVFKGDIHGDGIVRIDGKVEGNISSKQGIILGEKANVEGFLESDHIIIFGHIKGSVKSKELVLKTTGSVQGDIVSDLLEVEMGSKYDGTMKIGQQEVYNDGTQGKAKGATEQQEAGKTK